VTPTGDQLSFGDMQHPGCFASTTSASASCVRTNSSPAAPCQYPPSHSCQIHTVPKSEAAAATQAPACCPDLSSPQLPMDHAQLADVGGSSKSSPPGASSQHIQSSLVGATGPPGSSTAGGCQGTAVKVVGSPLSVLRQQWRGQICPVLLHRH
jgi:hypothetical protein